MRQEPGRESAADELWSTISAILLAADPTGIYFADVNNQNEYDAEARRISAELSRCGDELAVREVVWFTFVESFDVETAGDPGRYSTIARDVWQAYRAWLGRHAPDAGG